MVYRRSSWRHFQQKVEGLQAPRILLNLDDSPVDVADLHQYLTDNPIPGLEEVVMTRDGTIQQIYP